MATFLLVHGAWHDHRQWERLRPRLEALGHRSVVLDLPGHGDGEPRALPSDARSPAAGLDLDEVAAAIVDATDASDPPVLVTHSMSGGAATRALERAPDRFRAVVYLTAFVPVGLPTAGDYLATSEASGASGAGLFVADPGAVGAFRIDPTRTDEGYLSELHDAFYSDLAATETRALAERLTADLPLAFAAESPRATAGRWGSVPRGYIRCLADRVLPIALQDRMIADADLRAPARPFRVADLDSGHSPFFSQPDRLAEVLHDLASILTEPALNGAQQ